MSPVTPRLFDRAMPLLVFAAGLTAADLTAVANALFGLDELLYFLAILDLLLPDIIRVLASIVLGFKDLKGRFLRSQRRCAYRNRKAPQGSEISGTNDCAAGRKINNAVNKTKSIKS